MAVMRRKGDLPAQTPTVSLYSSLSAAHPAGCLAQVRIVVMQSPASRLIPHTVQILAILNCVDLLDEVLKDVADVDVCEGTGLHEEKLVLASEVGGEFARNFAL